MFFFLGIAREFFFFGRTNVSEFDVIAATGSTHGKI